MYTFSVRKNITPILEITIDEEMIKENPYFQNLIEKCFERVFQMITRDENKEEDSSEEVDFEEED